MQNSALFRELEKRIEHIEPRPRAPGRASSSVVQTGISPLDALLPQGGLPRGRTTEWTGSRSSGKTTLLRAMLERVRGTGESVAIVDADRTLYAPDWAGLETGAGRFWIIRPPSEQEAIWCTDLILRSGAFGSVTLSHDSVMRRPVTVRLQRLAEEADAVFITLGEVPVAALRLRFRPGRIEPVISRPFGPFLPSLRPIWIQVGAGGKTEVPILCPPPFRWRCETSRDRKGPEGSGVALA